ncbi:MAG: sigma-54-dependent transcriptional regulator, partial [Parahaliea sp.]
MTAYCLIVDGDTGHADSLSALARDAGFDSQCLHSLAAAREVLAQQPVDVLFLALDLPGGEDGLELLRSRWLSATDIVVMGDRDEPPRADEAVRRGAAYFCCKPIDEQYISTLLADIAQECGAAAEAECAQQSTVCTLDQFGFLRGSSRSMRKLYRQLRKVAETEASLLVVGESGTGKELVARTVHHLSSRSEGPLIAFNCAAVAENLMESELFGHEKGSFSGAERRHRGFFEQADGGTLVLDEITEMDFELQAKLLRVLETRMLRRVGAETEFKLDVRVISATNRSPEEAVAQGQLREDLYYRLAQFPVYLPPLRERGADIAGLAQIFLNELNARHETELCFSEEGLEHVRTYGWPGNVRQL